MSLNTTETQPLPAVPVEDRPVARGQAVQNGRRVAAVVSPFVALLLALAAHLWIPNSDSSVATHWYPLLLEGLLPVALLFAVAPWFWQSLRPLAFHSGPLLAGAIGWLGFWDLLTLKMAWMPMPYFPGPDAVLEGMFDDRWVLLDSTYHSLKLLLSGYLTGVVAGLVSGILMGWFRRARYWGMPVLKVVGPIPATAYVPLAMVLFANAFFSGTLLVALAVWFPVTMLTTSGIANVPASYFDVARTLGAGRAYLIFRVAVPAALPNIFIGLFMGLGASFLTLIVAETVGVRSGLGWYLKWQQGFLEYAKVYAALVIMAFFFSGLMTVLFKLRDRVLGWQKGVIRW